MAFDALWVGDNGPHLAMPSVAAAPVAMQRSLKNAIHCAGVGLHSGQKVSLTLAPAPADHGIVFHRRDLGISIPALWTHAVESPLCTTLRHPEGAKVATVEHLMAALAGCGIDNAVVEVDGAEVPIMDGSAAPFVFLIECVGTEALEAPRRTIEVLKPVRVGDDRRWAQLLPAKDFSLAFAIDFDSAAIGQQEWQGRPTPTTFRRELARARTFGFLREVEALRAQGLARGGSLENAVVVDGDRIVNPDGLRFDDEFVRHKALDALGDLALAGYSLQGRFEASRSSHAMTLQLLRRLFAEPGAYRLVPTAAAQPALFANA